MKFDVIRALHKQELLLEKGIDDASKALVGDERLANSYRAGRISRNKCWHTFISFARPINEARNHISAEREYLEAQAEREISEAVKAIKGRKR